MNYFADVIISRDPSFAEFLELQLVDKNITHTFFAKKIMHVQLQTEYSWTHLHVLPSEKNMNLMTSFFGCSEDKVKRMILKDKQDIDITDLTYMRECLGISEQEVIGFLKTTQRSLKFREKSGDALLLSLYKAIKAHKKYVKGKEVNLARARVKKHLSVDQAASVLKISADDLIVFEAKNAVPLSFIDQVADLYALPRPRIDVGMNVNSSIHLGAEIKSLRRLKKITQKEMVHELKTINVNKYNAIENGVRIPSLEILYSIAQILETTVDLLLVS